MGIPLGQIQNSKLALVLLVIGVWYLFCYILPRASPGAIVVRPLQGPGLFIYFSVQGSDLP